VPVRKEPPCQRETDKAGGAGNQDFHELCRLD
jgi:hypothetical protein